ncbi:probable alpha-glucosidase Os06g0675700 [Physcomitrium patens]|uniref:Maltase n=1 Tax=Physcomitrium patens TaxID=3218 RepID=A0A2K1KBQ6_PHYPA|nr:probable alpha-glucosidase Os06g0675700 [Physcomitrium patens]PNR51202.1 hypothetical protein PHYPA_010388 [Physcomitrium patens]|eukprot:XP_024380169.1 probable alpha-glucosidase Os06g0675700 [Physcomitrella patens]
MSIESASLRMLTGMAAVRVMMLLALVLPTVSTIADLSSGYRMTEINELADGSGVVAHLELTSGCETYGPNLKELRLTARYEDGGRVHIHITDPLLPRWEIPDMLIPRDRVEHIPIGQSTSPIRFTETSYTLKRESNWIASHQLKITWTKDPFSFSIIRRSNGDVLFNTLPEAEGGRYAFNPMVFKDQYLEISTRLPQNSCLYGLGESTRPSGMRLVPGQSYTLWATDIGSWNLDFPLYGSYPFLMDMRPDGQTHGVLFLNSNGMDIEYKSGDSLTFQVIGGVFDFYFFAGPSPMGVVDEYTQLVGRPAAMPYWSFGFHQARYGYKDIEELESVLAKYDAINFPVESIWADIDHMDGYRDFTLHPEHFPEKRMRSFVQGLHLKNQKLVMILDPGIKIDETYATFTRGRELGVYLRNGTGDGYYVTQVWPGATHIPDFLHPNALDWWTKEVEEFYKIVPFDGIWLDMNEPANFCSGPNCWFDPAVPCIIIDSCCMTCDNDPDKLTRWDNPPYKINGYKSKLPIYKNTVATSALHYDGTPVYNTHNVYGMAEGLATYKALEKVQKKRPFVLSRSSFVGGGAHSAHWTGDNGATWTDMKHSIASMLNSGLFGVPMVGVDLCGFYMETNEELCERWTQLGAFYPFARSHSDIHTGPQEIYLWKSVTETASKAFYWRYRLLPFFYTLMYEAHTSGAPIARPLFFEYWEDKETWEIDTQFLLGSSILVSPVLEPNQTSVRAYFPKGIWYNLFDTSDVIRAEDHGIWKHLSAPKDTINVHVRRGSIVPMQDFAMTTTLARKTPFSLLVAFAPSFHFAEFCAAGRSIVCRGIDREFATGQIYLDDDAQPTMDITEGRASLVKLEAIRTYGHYVLRSTVTQPDCAINQRLIINTVVVLGLQARPFSVHLNGRLASVQVNANDSMMELSGLNLFVREAFELIWNIMPNGNGVHSR